MRHRQLVIEGLRAVADYLEARPDLPAPYIGQLHAFPDPKTLSVVARAMGGFQKDHDGKYLTLVKEINSAVSFAVVFASEEVCERVVVGTKEVPEKVIPAHVEEIIEWKCPESLLVAQ